MKLLILSPEPWRKDNSFGNSYSSIFGKLEGVEIAHIYTLEGKPDYEPNIKCYYQIPEGEVIVSAIRFWGRTKGAGHEVILANEPSDIQKQTSKTKKPTVYQRLLAFGKRKHWRSLFFARELAWKMGKINYDGMMKFIHDFNPDLFFLSYNHIFYTNRIAMYIKKRLDVPMVMEMAMDHYSMNRVSYDPIFWIDRLLKRRVIRNLVKQSSFMYVISKKMKQEYEDMLGIECKLLYKTPDISRQQSLYTETHNPIRFLFTGNIYANRWKSLAMLVSELKKQGFGRLDIYTATPISKKMQEVLDVSNVSYLHAPVSQDEVIQLQNEADVLVHTEAFDKYNKSLVRCAISTKIMDYLCVGRCILAIGPNDISSIEYLSDNELAMVASDKASLTQVLTTIKQEPAVLFDYAKRGMVFVQKELDAEKIRQGLYDDLQLAIDNYHRN